MKKPDQNVIGRILRDARKIAGWLALSAILAMLAVICAVIIPEILGALVQKLYDFGISDRTVSIRRELVSGCILLAAVYGVKSLLQFGNVQIMNRAVSRRFTYGLRVGMSEKLSRLPIKFVDQTPVGDILNRMIDDVGEMGGGIHQIFDTMIRGVFQILVICVVLFMENGILAALVVLLTPVSMWLSAKIAAKCEKNFDDRFETSGNLSELVEESFTNFATTKAYNLEQYMEKKHETVNQRLRNQTATASFISSVVQPLIKFGNALAYILIALIGVLLIRKGQATVQTVVTIALLAQQFGAPLEEIANGFAYMNRVKAAAKRVYEILDMEEEPCRTQTLENAPQGEVAFENVSFSYRADQPLIEDLNIHVRPGQKIAIVGPTGAGKTTIVNLLMRFYDVDGGHIRLDGVDIGTLSADDVRSRFAMVLQDTWLFQGTIAENVAYGTENATREDVERACEKAYCDHFIRTMPQGYDTPISEDTTNLSGGQKQLLTIARALLANRPLLILDEATSNVDTRTEMLIQDAMDQLMEGKTCFVIAHRLSTIVNSDLILVLDHGKVVEQGTHDGLLEAKGLYYRLFTSQYTV